MALPDYIHYKNDLCYGDSDPNGELDTGNRPHKGAWGNFTNYTGTEGYGAGTGEHDDDGDHMSGLLALFWKEEPISWTGNGADDRDISLSDGDLDVKFIRVLEASTAGTWWRSETMAGDLTFHSDLVNELTDYVQSVGTGTFQVGTSLNVGSRDYYAIVYGV
jgi:hypothetical protein